MKKLIYSLMALAMVACAKAPTDQEVTAFYDKLQEVVGDFRTPQAVVEQTVMEMLDSNSFSMNDLTFDQLRSATMYRSFLRSVELKEAFREALQQYIVKQDTIGARAAVLCSSFVSRGQYDSIAQIAANHPYYASLLQNPMYAEDALIAVLSYQTDVEQSPAMGKLVEALIPSVPVLDNNALSKAMRAFQAAITDENVTPEQREALRLALIERNEQFRAEGKAEGDGSIISYSNDYEKLLTSAIAKGELMGHAAPEINFLWSSDKNTKPLSSYKGKVVVVDFWATWCGPCFRSFPNIRALQERYKGYDVEILGVTSLQGRHVRRYEDGRTESVDTRNKPEEEYKLMKEFMKEHNMTWKVLFSEGSCFDKNYGVFGIPHVAIIDAEGVVRYNALRPYDAPYHEAEKIDALLKEAGKKVPSEPMSTENFAK